MGKLYKVLVVDTTNYIEAESDMEMQVNFWEEEEIIVKLDKIARDRGTKRSSLIREAIRRTIKEAQP